MYPPWMSSSPRSRGGWPHAQWSVRGEEEGPAASRERAGLRLFGLASLLGSAQGGMEGGRDVDKMWMWKGRGGGTDCPRCRERAKIQSRCRERATVR
jgi:hypothetical protein